MQKKARQRVHYQVDFFWKKHYNFLWDVSFLWTDYEYQKTVFGKEEFYEV